MQAAAGAAKWEELSLGLRDRTCSVAPRSGTPFPPPSMLNSGAGVGKHVQGSSGSFSTPHSNECRANPLSWQAQQLIACRMNTQSAALEAFPPQGEPDWLSGVERRDQQGMGLGPGVPGADKSNEQIGTKPGQKRAAPPSLTSLSPYISPAALLSVTPGEPDGQMAAKRRPGQDDRR